MPKRPKCGLLFRIGAIPHGSALHEDDRVMSVLPGDSGRQSKNEPRLRTAGDLFEAVSGEVVTLVHDQVAVSSYAVIHHTLAYQALNDRHINSAGRLVPASADPSDGGGRQLKK
jgi:hypothetical protein